MPSCTVFGLKQEEVDVMKKEGLKVRLVISASKSSIQRFVISEKAPTRAFS